MSDADYMLVGDLFVAARREADALRCSAKQARDEQTRSARLRAAMLIEELVRYARDRDRALAARVTACAASAELEKT